MTESAADRLAVIETCTRMAWHAAEDAAAWARGQSLWRYGSELDFSDRVTSVIVLGGRGERGGRRVADVGGCRRVGSPYTAVEVRNYAAELGPVTDGIEDLL